MDGVDFGMGFSVTAVVAFGDDPSVFDGDRSHHGVGADPAPASPGEFQSSFHECFV
jgi:hypothetical protein